MKSFDIILEILVCVYMLLLFISYQSIYQFYFDFFDPLVVYERVVQVLHICDFPVFLLYLISSFSPYVVREDILGDTILLKFIY